MVIVRNKLYLFLHYATLSMNSISRPALANWIPYKLSLRDENPQCYWMYTGDTRYTAPFFDETINECLGLRENSAAFRSMSSLNMLEPWSATLDTVSPSAFIFHVSRCGSTLISQLLGIPQQHIVLAEVPFFDALLRSPYSKRPIDAALLPILLNSALRLYGQVRRGDETHLFIKCDSWHLCFYRQLRQLYPEVPFILLYRSPDEVIQSQRRQRGMQSVQGVVEPGVFGFEESYIQQLSLDDYMALVLERYFQIMLEVAQDDKNMVLVNYGEPILSIIDKIAAVSGVTITPAYRQQMEERSKFHAKYPDQVFREPAATEPLPASVQRVMAFYEQLDALRLKL